MFAACENQMHALTNALPHLVLSDSAPQMLDIKPEMFNETLLAIATDELRKINACKTPGDKVACVVSNFVVF